MADLSITAANVKLSGTAGAATTKTVTFGETVTNGQAVYKKSSDGKYWLADNDVALGAAADVAGIALVGNSADGVGVIVTAGPMVIGATVTDGMNYVLSSTTGAIAPVADLGSSDYIVSLGHAISTTVLHVDIKNYEATV